jgi:hypothetical protein
MAKNGKTEDNIDSIVKSLEAGLPEFDAYLKRMPKELKEYLKFLSSGRKPNKKGGKIKSKYSKGGGVRTAKYKV